MKTQSIERPPVFKEAEDGVSKFYNFNIKEAEVEIEGNKQAGFEYDFIQFVGDPDYGKFVSHIIRMKYSTSDELALLRQRETKPEKFAEYNAFCEGVKVMVKNDINSLEG